MWQVEQEYPCISLMITDNPKYMEGRKICRTRKEAEEAFGRWLTQNFAYLK